MRRSILFRHFLDREAQEFKRNIYRALEKYTASDVLFDLRGLVEKTQTYEERLRMLHNLTMLQQGLRPLRNNPRFKDFFTPNNKKLFPLESLILDIQSYLKRKQEERIDFYTKAFSGQSEVGLRAIIASCKEELKVSSVDRVEQTAKWHGALKALHPKFQIVAVLDRCVPAAMILERAIKNGFETILFVTEEELSQRPAALADHLILVSSLKNHKECLTKLEAWLKENEMMHLDVALDPGWGVRSESAELSADCEAHNQKNATSRIFFVGPKSDPMLKLGDKWHSNNLAMTLGVDVIPGYYGEAQDPETLLQEAMRLGLGKIELMIKGPGGGGSGNTRISKEVDLEVAKQKFRIAVDNIRLKDEKAKIIIQSILENLVHKEIQIICESNGPVYLGERECSKQTVRGQKNFEEAVCFSSEDENLRQDGLKIAQGAWRLGYRGVMTVEFFIANGKNYFGEVNPRLQVENGVTSLALGGANIIDLRHWVASGKTVQAFFMAETQKRNLDWQHKTGAELILSLKQSSSAKYVIQARVHAEGVEAEKAAFRISPVEGRVTQLTLPSKGVCSGVLEGSYVNTYEVSQIIMIIYGEGNTPEEARKDLLEKLSQTEVKGIPTNLAYLRASLEYWLKHPRLPIHTGTSRHFETYFESLGVKPEKHETLAPKVLAYALSSSLWVKPRLIEKDSWEFHSLTMGRD